MESERRGQAPIGRRRSDRAVVGLIVALIVGIVVVVGVVGYAVVRNTDINERQEVTADKLKDIVAQVGSGASHNCRQIEALKTQIRLDADDQYNRTVAFAQKNNLSFGALSEKDVLRLTKAQTEHKKARFEARPCPPPPRPH